MARIQELREERAKLIADARKILDLSKTEKRDLTSEENGKADELMDLAEKRCEEIKAMEDGESRSRRIEALDKVLSAGSTRKTGSTEISTGNPGEKVEKRTGENGKHEIRYTTRSGVERRFIVDGRRGTDEYRKAFENYLAGGSPRGLDVGGETRDLQADSDTDGGYLMAPTQLMANMIQAVDDLVFVRQYATVIPLRGAQNLGAPVLDTDVSDADWTTEIQTGTKDTALKFGKRELNPAPLAKRILISRKLLRSSTMPVESMVQARLSYKFGVTQEKSFLLGDGTNQPLGLFTPSANGISTGRDVVTGSTTAILADGLIDAKFALKAAYWNRSSTRWMFHRDAIRQIRKLKDSTNQYLWSPGLTAGEPDRILDVPYDISEFVPNVFTTGRYVGLIGDLSQYWIAEALSLEVQRLNELYAESNQVGYIGRMELDGMPVLEEAFVRVRTS